MDLYFYKKHIRRRMMGSLFFLKRILFPFSFFFQKQFLWCGSGLLWGRSCLVINTSCDKNGRILILDAELNGTSVLLINIYNSNSESEQLSFFSTLQKLLKKVDDYNKKILFLEVILIWFLIVSLIRSL